MLTSIYAQNIDSKLDDIKSAMINGNYEGGLNECKELLKSNINDTMQLALVYGYAGLSSEALRKKEDAIEYYKMAVLYQVPQLDIYDKLINLSKKAKNDSVYEFALLEKAKAYPEYNEEIMSSLAYHYVNTMQYEKLLSTTNELLKLYPSDVNYLFFKGIALQNLNQAEDAKNYYNEVLKLNSEHPGANMSLGMFLYNEGSEIFAFRKKQYESIAKPDRVDYTAYDQGIEKGKVIYRQALPYLLIAYESGSYPDLKKILFNIYVRLEQKDKAEPYR